MSSRRRHVSSADRQRRHHARITNGRMIVPVEIDDTAVSLALISAGFLSPDAVDNRKAIGRARAQFDFNQCTRIFLVTAIPHESPDDTAAVFDLNCCRTRKIQLRSTELFSRLCETLPKSISGSSKPCPKGITFKGPSTVSSQICLTKRG